MSLSLLALAACSRDESALPTRRAPTASPPPPRVASAASAASAAPRAAPSAPPVITPEARKAYAAHLQAGRKLAADKRWGEATVELEKALANVPHDPRALVDLGWSAHHAGDAKKARRASKEALRRAPDAETKAKALYNLGRIAEADGKRDDAAKSYAESLRLRPNETVQRQLDALTKAQGAPSAQPAPSATTATSATLAPPLPCTAATPLEELTACIGKATRLVDDGDGDSDDARAPEIVPLTGASTDLTRRVAIVRAAESRMEEQFVLVASSLRGWTTVAELVRTYNPGAFGILEEASFPKVEIRDVKGHKVLWLEVLRRRHDSDLGVDEEETEEARDVVLCVLADERRRETVCPVKLPLSTSYSRERMDRGELDEETKKLSTPGLPISREATYSVTISNDGVVTTRLVKGAPDERTLPLLGARRLF